MDILLLVSLSLVSLSLGALSGFTFATHFTPVIIARLTHTELLTLAAKVAAEREKNL